MAYNIHTFLGGSFSETSKIKATQHNLHSIFLPFVEYDITYALGLNIILKKTKQKEIIGIHLRANALLNEY